MDVEELNALARGESEWAEIDDVKEVANELIALRIKVAQQDKIIAAYNTSGCADADAMALAYLELRERFVDTANWTKQPPTEQGDYWHWDGNPDSAPFIHQVMWSGTAQKCFISKATVSTAPWCDEHGGWWKRIEQPKPPQAS